MQERVTPQSTASYHILLAGIGIVERFDLEPRLRPACHGVAARLQHLPEGSGVFRTSWELESEPDNCDCLHG